MIIYTTKFKKTYQARLMMIVEKYLMKFY